jgi:hypothetical protein
VESIQEYLRREYPRITTEFESEFISDSEKEIAEQDPLEWRERYVWLSLSHAVLTHFGFPSLKGRELHDLFERTVEATVEYYWGDWWTPEKAAELLARIDTSGIPKVNLRSLSKGMPEMDPANKGEQSLLRQRVSGAILISLFARKREELARICDWFDLRVQPRGAYAMTGCEEEYELGILYLISRFRNEPIPGIEKVVKKVERCRHKRPKVFLNLIDAVFDGDEDAYRKLLPESLELHFHRFEPTVLSDLIAFEQSALAEFARQKGMQPPPLEGRAKYALMTPHTLGFEE